MREVKFERNKVSYICVARGRGVNRTIFHMKEIKETQKETQINQNPLFLRS
jgi:hypothetical protein